MEYMGLAYMKKAPQGVHSWMQIKHTSYLFFQILEQSKSLQKRSRRPRKSWIQIWFFFFSLFNFINWMIAVFRRTRNKINFRTSVHILSHSNLLLNPFQNNSMPSGIWWSYDTIECPQSSPNDKKKKSGDAEPFLSYAAMGSYVTSAC